MAITGISAISGEQIIAAGAVSAREAASAAFTTGGNSLQGLYDTVSNNSGSWTGGQASLPITAMSGNYSADYDVSQVVINYEENQGEPTHYRTTVGADGLSLYNSSNEDETNSIVYITPEYIDFKTTDDQHASIDPYIINDWNSTYNTVYDNSASWTGGSTYTGDAQGALDEVYSNSANWNGTTETVSSNSASWGGSALPISAGPGVKIDLVDNTLVFSNDETELLASTAASAFTLIEPFSSFEQVKIKLRWWNKVPDNYYNVERFTNNKCSLSWTYFDDITDGGPLELVGASWTSNNGIDYNLEGGFARTFGITSTGMAYFTQTPYPLSIVGINRIAGV